LKLDGRIALQALGAKLRGAARESSLEQAKVEERIAGRMQHGQRLALAPVAPAQPAPAIVTPGALVAGDERALARELGREVGAQPADAHAERGFEVAEVVVDGLMLVAGVAEDRRDALAPESLQCQQQGRGRVLAAGYTDDVDDAHAGHALASPAGRQPANRVWNSPGVASVGLRALCIR